jgi:hypothetical protein
MRVERGILDDEEGRAVKMQNSGARWRASAPIRRVMPRMTSMEVEWVQAMVEPSKPLCRWAREQAHDRPHSEFLICGLRGARCPLSPSPILECHQACFCWALAWLLQPTAFRSLRLKRGETLSCACVAEIQPQCSILDRTSVNLRNDTPPPHVGSMTLEDWWPAVDST